MQGQFYLRIIAASGAEPFMYKAFTTADRGSVAALTMTIYGAPGLKIDNPLSSYFFLAPVAQ